MQRKLLTSAVIALAFISLAILAVARAQLTPKNISVVLIIDNSGSMTDTDPADLRFVAARQLVDLLETGDEVSVIIFSDDSTVAVPLQKITDAASKEGVKAALEPLPSLANTNMSAALEDALAELGRGSNPVRFAIFLTDGELHPPGWPNFTAEQQEAERQKMFALASRFGEEDWALFPVSLASAVDPAFLDQLAQNGKGLFKQAPQADSLPPIFQEIFATKKLDIFEILFSDCLGPGQTQTVSFPVHEFVNSISIFITYTTTARPSVQVLTPEGTPLPVTTSEPQYEAFLLDAPPRGTWTVNVQGSAEESCVIISSSPRAQVEVTWLKPPLALELVSGGPLEIEVELQGLDPDTGEAVPVEDARVTVDATGPEGARFQAVLNHTGDGRYSGRIEAISVGGRYLLRLQAETVDGVLAQRTLEPVIELTAPPLASPTPTPSPEPTPTVVPPAAAEEGDGLGAPILLALILGPLGGVGLGFSSWALYCRFGRPRFRGYLESSLFPDPLSLEELQRRKRCSRGLTLGGPGNDINIGLDRTCARLIPERDGFCRIRCLSQWTIVVDGDPVPLGKEHPVVHRSEIEIDGRQITYRLQPSLPQRRRL